MDYNDEEYLKLFRKIKEDNSEEQSQMVKETPNYEEKPQMLRETPNYEQYQNMNEVRRQPQPQNFNMNEFNIETRVNGQKINEADPNGLNHLMGNENLNEVKRIKPQQSVNEVMQTDRQRLQQLHLERLKKEEAEREVQKLNEVVDFKDADIVTLEMFNRANYNSMMQVANRITPKG